MQLHHDVTN